MVWNYAFLCRPDVSQARGSARARGATTPGGEPQRNERETQQPEQTSNEKEKARETQHPEDTINEREDAYRPLCEETAPIGAEDERTLGTSASGEEVVCDGSACLAVPPRAPTV